MREKHSVFVEYTERATGGQPLEEGPWAVAG